MPVFGPEVTTSSVTTAITAAITAQPYKDVARAATTAALAALTATTQTLTANANGAIAAQDGITLVANDRLLVKDQAAAAQNGLYTVTQVGSAGTPFILTRTSDANTAAELAACLVPVELGTVNSKSLWFCRFERTQTLGTNDVAFSPIPVGA